MKGQFKLQSHYILLILLLLVDGVFTVQDTGLIVINLRNLVSTHSAKIQEKQNQLALGLGLGLRA
jgi:hypothetical protein